MFGIFTDLTKATVGVAVKTPLALAADVVTLGGALTDTRQPYTVSTLEEVGQNVSNATKPR